MDSSDEDTFDESNATEDEEEIDEIFEEDEIDDDGEFIDYSHLYRQLFEETLLFLMCLKQSRKAT